MRRKALAVVGLVAAGVIAWSFFGKTPLDRLREVETTLRARGEPVSLREIDPPLPPEGRNGAPVLEAALAWRDAALEDDPDWEERVIGPWNNVNPTLLTEATAEQLAETRAFLEPLAPYFEQVTRAVDCDEIVWPLGRLDHHGYEFRWVRFIQDTQRFLSARSYAAGTPEERLAGIRDALAMARRLRVRTQLDHLVAATIASSACRNATAALASDSIAPRSARAALEPLLRGTFRASMPDLLRHERALLVEILPFWLDGRAQAAIGGTPATFWEAAEKVLKDISKSRLWNRDPFAMDEVPGALLAMDDLIALDPMSGEAYVDALDAFADQPMLFAVTPRVAEKSLFADCLMALTRVTLAASVYHDEHGRWPTVSANLGSLFPEGVPPDPYTNAPFVFAIDEGTLVITATPWPRVLDPGDTLAEFGFEVRLPAR